MNISHYKRLLIKKFKALKILFFPLYKKDDVIRLEKSTGGKGFFAVMNGILGAIHEVDKGNLGGIAFEFTDGLYADKKGDNWLNYYFKFKNLPQIHHSKSKVKVFDDIPVGFHHLTRKTDREENFRILQKYIEIDLEILKEADVVSRNFKNTYTIGIHYRGTDKFTEAKPATYEQVLEHVLKETKKAGRQDFQLFIATDEHPFLDFMRREFGDRVIYLENTERSYDNMPVHHKQRTKKKPSLLGREALIDALVLSNTQLLIRTSSNLSLWSTYFNPDLKVVLVNNRFGSSTE